MNNQLVEAKASATGKIFINTEFGYSYLYHENTKLIDIKLCSTDESILSEMDEDEIKFLKSNLTRRSLSKSNQSL